MSLQMRGTQPFPSAGLETKFMMEWFLFWCQLLIHEILRPSGTGSNSHLQSACSGSAVKTFKRDALWPPSSKFTCSC